MCSWEGDVKATDFLTSLAAHLQPLYLGSQGWGVGRARGSRGGGSALSSQSSGFPCHYLGSERGLRILKLRGNDQRKTVKNYINMYLK